MNRGTSGTRLSWDDLVQLPEDGKRHELIDGEHYVTPTPVPRHQVVVGNLFGMIWSHLREHRTGHVYTAPFDVILSKHDVVEPDVLYISHERARTIELTPWVKGAPSLVVEVGSPGTRKQDETIKLELYGRYGVDEYWVVDTELDIIKVFRRSGGRFDCVAELRLDDGDILTTPLLPGLTIPLREVFAE